MSKLDQTCPNWIKPVQTGSNLSKLDQTCPNWIESVQIGSNLSKLDKTCPNWIKLVQIGSDLSKLVQTCPNWIKLVQISSRFLWSPCTPSPTGLPISPVPLVLPVPLVVWRLKGFSVLLGYKVCIIFRHKEL